MTPNASPPNSLFKRKPGEALSVEIWCKACLQLIVREGVQAVAVEPMTRMLGVTKGSFYWHFKSRDELISETLKRWERDQTQDLFARFEHIPDPLERLRILMFGAFEDQENGLFFAALSASSEDPRIKPFLQRVSEDRLGFVTQAFRFIGKEDVEARKAALLAYSAYVGYFHLLRAIPEQTRSVSDLSGFVRQLADHLAPKVGNFEEK